VYDADAGNPREIFGDELKGRRIMKAIWNDAILAESSETVVIEKNYYFPEDSINKNISARAKRIQFAAGKARRVIIMSRLAAKQTKTRFGFTPNRKTQHRKSKTTSRFGKALRLLPENIFVTEIYLFKYHTVFL
jgi:hypothetical protein